jgi:hypothetical protein
MAAGSHFKASGWKQFWWGKHWRKEWLAPVSFPLFDWNGTQGGFTPLKRGGGHETKSLRLSGGDGKEYVLRTIDKSLDALVPEAFKGSFIHDILNDQISTAHPYGPPVIADLSASLGLLHTNPVIVFVPDDPRLGEHKDDFANKLCLFEERPSGDGWENTALTNFADDIINSEKLFEKLAANNNKTVDQSSFLKVRLFDMLVNDWDRHEDQWIWTGKKTGGKTTYYAFARDRDQSFSKTDGVNMFLLSRPWALRAVQNMNGRVSDVIGTNLAATSLDRQFTNELTEEDWENVITSLKESMTNEVIEKAVSLLPAPIHSLSGDFLNKRLQQRRDDMLRFGMRYYKILTKKVTVTGSNQKELFTINRLDANTTEITIQSGSTGDTIYHRIFMEKDTKEINLYGLGGEDQFIYTGISKNKILVRALGGDGEDIYTDTALTSHSGKKPVIYDIAENKPTTPGSLRYKSTTDTSFTNFHRKSYKYDWWIPIILPGYNPDDGLIIGAGLLYRKQQWNKTPYGWQQTIIGNYATSTGAYNFSYKGIFKSLPGKWDVEVAANYNAPAYVLNFYGFGNESKLSTNQKSFYRVRARGLFLNPSLSRSWKNNKINAGLIYSDNKVESSEGKFINQPIPLIDSSIFRTKYFAGANLSYTFSLLNEKKYPALGLTYNAAVSYLRNIKEGKRDFLNLQSNVTVYYSPFKHITFVHRTGASTNIGDYEFFQANTLGGSENLRGYWRTRYTGRTNFYQNTDIRWRIAELRGYVFRGSFGVYGFFDDGRVWIKEEHSTLLHTGYGGGIYFIPYSTLTLNMSCESSKEINLFIFRAKFLF